MPRKATISVIYDRHSVHLGGNPRLIYSAAKAVKSPCMRHATWPNVVSVPASFGPAVEARLARLGHRLIAEIPVAA